MKGHDRKEHRVIFIIGIIIAFMIAILGFTVFIDVGNGLGTAFSIIGEWSFYS